MDIIQDKTLKFPKNLYSNFFFGKNTQYYFCNSSHKDEKRIFIAGLFDCKKKKFRFLFFNFSIFYFLFLFYFILFFSKYLPYFYPFNFNKQIWVFLFTNCKREHQTVGKWKKGFFFILFLFFFYLFIFFHENHIS